MTPDILNVTDYEPSSNWDMEEGYDFPKDTEPYPFRIFGTGKGASFSILLRVFNQDIDYLCGGPIQGFEISFHAPNERPYIWRKPFQITLGRSAIFTINPSLIITSPNVRDYTPNERQCYFNSERRLQFFKQYTQRNCEIECFYNFTLAECGCVKFSMPRRSTNSHETGTLNM